MSQQETGHRVELRAAVAHGELIKSTPLAVLAPNTTFDCARC